jgi:hypothetical protein
MTSRQFSVALYVVIALAGVALQLLSLGRQSRIPSLGTVLSRVMASRSGRVGIMAGWMWLGLHFFGR